jgi:CBS domain-containing protein
MTLQELLDRKQSALIYVSASDKLLDAIGRMSEHKVGSLLVQSDDGQLRGILTERDVLRFCSERPDALPRARIDEVMTRDLIVATPDSSIDEAMSLMTEQRFRHLPVIDGGVPVGMISIGDLVKAKLNDVSVEVKYLREYISA